MTTRAPDAGVRAVPERYGWTLRVLLALAVLYGLIALVTAVTQAGQLAAWLQPGARVPVVMGTDYVLPTNGGSNGYGGGPFVRDGTAVVATQVSTTVDGLALGNRLALGLSPLLWSVTALVVALLLAAALRRLARGASFGRDASRPVVLAAIALALGSTLAQVAQGASDIAFGAFMWAAPAGVGSAMSRDTVFSFELAPLFAACGLLAVALVLRRGLALQRDVDGLV